MVTTHSPLPAGPFVPRSFNDYLRLFGLEESGLSGRRILDFPAGAGTFAAEAAFRGLDVTASDPRYGRSTAALALQAEAFPAGDRTSKTKGYRALLGQFLDDYYREFPNGRYVAAHPLELPFGDNSFDLVLSRDFLFQDQLGLEPDLQAAICNELLRVTRSEVRIHPISNEGGAPAESLAAVMPLVANATVRAERVAFDWGAGSVQETLVLRKT